MSENAEGYKVSNYPHFPGSLGNWAGQELGIPTYTLELPNIHARQNDKFWKLFREAIHHASSSQWVLCLRRSESQIYDFRPQDMKQSAGIDARCTQAP